MSKEIMTAIQVLESTQHAPEESEDVEAEIVESMESMEGMEAEQQMIVTHDDGSYELPRLVQWNESSALLLLNTYKEYIQEFSSPFTKKKTVWKKIAQIMNDIHGYGVTAVQCENKFKSMSVAYRKACESNKRSVASHRSQTLFKELDDLFRHNPIVHHIGNTSSNSGVQYKDPCETQAEEVLQKMMRGTGKGKKRKNMELPEWISRIMEGVERRHKERMERYDKLISILDKLADK